MSKTKKAVDESHVLESEFQAQIWLRIGQRDDVRLWRQNSGKALLRGPGGTRAIQGAPTGACDLTGIVAPEGWRLEIEVKGSRYRPNPKKDAAQDRWADRIREFGGIHVKAVYNRIHSMAENVDRVNYTLDVEIAKKRGTLLGEKKSCS